MDIFFAKLFGLYFMIVGLIVMVRKQSIMPAVKDFVKNKPLLFMLGTIELAAGLALVITHPMIALTPAGIIAIIGWVLVVEGILYLTLPYKMMQKFVMSFNVPGWYIAGGAASILLGAYLAWYGFGLI